MIFDLQEKPASVQSELTRKDGEYLQNLKRVVVGSGNKVMKTDPNGFFLGDANYADAPFKVDFRGNLTTGGTIQGATIKNGDGEIVIDATGLNSANNFRADAISSSTQQTTSSGSFVDLPGSTMDSFTLERDTVVIVNASAFGYNNRYEATDGQDTDSMSIQLVSSVDGVLDVLVFGGIPFTLLDEFFFPITAAIQPNYITSTKAYLLSAGTHTLKLQFKKETVGTAVVDGFGLSYSILGV